MASSCGCHQLREKPAGWSELRPGGSSCSGAAAALRSLFYVKASSSTLKPWAKGYRDFSELMAKIVQMAIPAPPTPQVVIIDLLKDCDGKGALKREAGKYAAALRWNAAVTGVVGGACGLIPGLQLVGILAVPGAALTLALSQVLDDYGAGRAIDVGTLARAATTLAAAVGGEGALPPEVRSAAKAAASTGVVVGAVASFAGKQPAPPKGNAVNTDVDNLRAFVLFTLASPTMSAKFQPTPGTTGKFALTRAKYSKALVVLLKSQKLTTPTANHAITAWHKVKSALGVDLVALVDGTPQGKARLRTIEEAKVRAKAEALAKAKAGLPVEKESSGLAALFAKIPTPVKVIGAGFIARKIGGF